MKTSTLLLSLLCAKASLTAAILGGPITNSANGHLYYILTANTWLASEAEAVRLGGHLVTINDADENEFVYSTFSTYDGVNRVIWIGLHDFNSEGEFRWVSGEPFGYRRWRYGEPNNFNGAEGAVMLLSPNDRGPGLWNDGQRNNLHHGVVEVIPSTAAALRIQKAVEISWESQTTNHYQVQWSSALDTNNWFHLGAPLPGTGATQNLFDRAGAGETRFYRVVTLP